MSRLNKKGPKIEPCDAVRQATFFAKRRKDF